MTDASEEKKWLAELERRKLKAAEAEKQKQEESLMMPMTLFFSKIFQAPLKSFQNRFKSRKNRKSLLMKRKNSFEDQLLVEQYKKSREEVLKHYHFEDDNHIDLLHLRETMNKLKPEDSARPYTRGPR